jgi:hypothetical protein
LRAPELVSGYFHNAEAVGLFSHVSHLDFSFGYDGNLREAQCCPADRPQSA